MENMQLSVYKSLINFEKISTLDFMRKNPEFLDVPGYEISRILNDGVNNGYVERFEDANIAYYSATNKCRELIKRIKKDEQEAELLEAKQQRQKKNKRNIVIGLIVLAVCLVVALIFFFATVVVPKMERDAFVSEHGQSVYDRFGIVSKGDYIELGSYELDDNTSNGKESIEWLVLEVQDGKMLVISRYILDVKQYHPEYPVADWYSSSLCNWLNNDFFTVAFSEKEKRGITGTPEDKLFLLSTSEAETYFRGLKERKCTEYGGSYGCSWWLSTLGLSNVCADIVDHVGCIDDGANILWEKHGVRPAMWVDLSETE